MIGPRLETRCVPGRWGTARRWIGGVALVLAGSAWAQETTPAGAKRVASSAEQQAPPPLSRAPLLVPGVALTPHSSADALDASEAAFVAARRPVSLRDAVTLALQKNPELLAARAQELQAEARSRLAYAVLRPEVKATATYVLTSAEQKFQTSSFVDAFQGTIDAAIRGAGPAYGNFSPPNEAVLAAVRRGFAERVGDSFKDTTIVARNSVYGSLVLSQVIFSPQFWMIPAADRSAEAARLGSREAREQVLLAISKLYLGLEGIGELEAAARDASAVALRRERDARAQAAAGMSTEINVLRAQTESAQARSLTTTLVSQRVSLLALLEAMVGEPVRPLDVRGPPLTLTPSSEADAPWESTWLVRAQAKGLEAVQAIRAFDELSWLPTVAVQGKASYNSNSGFSGRNTIFDGIVAAEWSLYDRGVRSANGAENAAKAVQQRAQLEGAKAKARATWVAARTNVDAARAVLEQAEAQAQLAGRAQRQAEAAHAVGMLTALELSDIDSKRFLAASSVVQSRSQLEVRKVELAAAEGRLSEVLGAGVSAEEAVAAPKPEGGTSRPRESDPDREDGATPPGG